MSATPAAARALQPLLHDLVAVVAAPTQAWAGRDGQVRPDGAQGAYHSDVRVLSEAVLTVGGREPEAIAVVPRGADAVMHVGLARQLGDDVPDPTVRVERTRRVAPGLVEEEVVLRSWASEPVVTVVEVRLACDLAPMDAVKAGRRSAPVVPRGLEWSQGPATVVLEPGTAAVEAAGAGLCLRWRVRVDAAAPVTLGWAVTASDRAAVVVPAASPPRWDGVGVRADDRRLQPLVARGLADLAGLVMAPAGREDQAFLAAGAPWFFTLFGRDSLWAARLLLPYGTGLAASTLRALAARQGAAVDPATAEEPGKVLHEVRRGTFRIGAADDDPARASAGIALPPVYYGTVDATPLWVCLLHDAWRWGLDPGEVEALLPHVEPALRWMVEHGDADGDGFLEYVDRSGHGLANQGWKDSGDSVQWRSGGLARAPLALCEVQGYAHEAALAGAALLEAFGRPGADRWRAWAERLAQRFRERFWVDGPDGPHPAIALDQAKRAVDSLTSNVGHLLGTGLLDAAEEALVVQRLTAPSMDSGFGLRTLSTSAAGFAPLGYHLGTVWPHDTAIVVAGMVRAGHGDAAASLVDGLLAAGAAFDARLPELYGGDARADVPTPVPYPAACRPQAWAAAAGASLAPVLLGLVPDAPAGALHVAPVAPSPVGALSVTGLRFGGAPLAVAVAADGAVASVRAAAGTAVTSGERRERV